MKYIVLFKKSPSARRLEASEVFTSLMDAEDYADTVSPDRDPVITPFMKMNPGGSGEFTIDDMDTMGEIVEELRQLMIFSFDGHGAALIAQHLVISAYANLELASQNLKMAALHQARETAGN